MVIETLAAAAKEVAKFVDVMVEAAKKEAAELPEKIGELSEVEALPDKIDLLPKDLLSNNLQSSEWSPVSDRYSRKDKLAGTETGETITADGIESKTDGQESGYGNMKAGGENGERGVHHGPTGTMPEKTEREELLPRNDGHWEGEPGDSAWIPDRDYTPLPKKKSELPYNNPDNLPWGKILDKYDIEEIPFKDGEPDFSKISRGQVEIESYTDNRDDNFDKADIELSKQKGCTPEEVEKWRKENNYTWHECKDMRTMQKVPNEIHANIPHSGGIAEAKKGTGTSND